MTESYSRVEKDYAEWPDPNAERKHHRFSPSTLQNREVCPCYDSTGEANEAAIEGTIAHGAAETGKDDDRLSDGHAAMVAECLDFIEQRKSGPFFAEGGSELKEVYLPVDDLETTAGYVDHVLLNPEKTYAEMIDWKFGKWPVEPAENNLQGIAYALGLFRAYPSLQTIRFFFKQPAIGLTTEALWDRIHVPALYGRVRAVVEKAKIGTAQAAENDFRLARPMIPACNFCANIGACTKVTDLVCKVGSKYHPIEIPADITPSAIHSPANTNLGLRLAQVVKIWADGFRRLATNRIVDGSVSTPEGYMLVSQTRRSIADDALFEKVALQYLSRDEYNDTKKILFGAVEKAIMNKAERGTKKAAVEEFADRLAAVGATEESQPYTFLKAVAKKENSTNTTQPNT